MLGKSNLNMLSVAQAYNTKRGHSMPLQGEKFRTGMNFFFPHRVLLDVVFFYKVVLMQKN